MNDIELVVAGDDLPPMCPRGHFAAARRSGGERVTANPARSLVHLSGSITLAEVLAAFEPTTDRPVVQRGA